MTTIMALYLERASTPSDINEHMAYLGALASECQHITEFGTRGGNSTAAFLAGLPPDGLLESYDISPCQDAIPAELHLGRWRFHQANTATLEYIAETDLLFIDTLHTCDQVKAELAHGNRARKYLVFHDTVLFGSRDETGGGPGILPAINLFIEQNPHWTSYQAFEHNNGLLILRRK